MNVARPLALAAALAAVRAAHAQTSYAPPPPSMAPPTAAPPAAPANPYAPPAAVPAEPPLQLVATFGADFGSTKLIGADMSDGSTRWLRANQGVSGSLGAAFLKLRGGQFATQATIGVEYSAITASNGSVRWLAFPLEVMEMAYLDPIRLGAGISYLLSPSVKGEEFFEGIEADYENSLGLVLQADYVFRLKNHARGGRFTLGGRYVVQKLKLSGGTESFDANAFGVVLGFVG